MVTDEIINKLNYDLESYYKKPSRIRVSPYIYHWIEQDPRIIHNLIGGIDFMQLSNIPLVIDNSINDYIIDYIRL